MVNGSDDGSDDLSAPLVTGKIPPGLLSQILPKGIGPAQGVQVGPALGEDAAVLRPSPEHLLVVTSDPITMASAEQGRYLVHVNANDIAVMGARPRWLVLSLLFPEGKTMPDDVRQLADQIRQTADALGIVVVGGHSEVTSGLDRCIAVGFMMGEVASGALLDKRSIQAGDHLWLARGVAIEGTAILATEHHDRLLGLGVSREVLERAAMLLDQPGISVVADASFAASVEGVRALHDPTEGGLAAAVCELAEISGCDLEIEGAQIPVLEETRVICEAIGIDPLTLLASGGLLIAASSAAEAELRKSGRGITPIGRFVERAGAECRVSLTVEGQTRDVHPPPTDGLHQAEQRLGVPD